MRLIDRILCAFGRCRVCHPLTDVRGLGGVCSCCGKIHGWMWRAEIDVALGFARVYSVIGDPPTHIAQLPKAIVHHGERLTRDSTPLQ